jgi:cytochrome c biogenesis protein CcmG, thiol:disulfide interchange protein DsbE
VSQRRAKHERRRRAAAGPQRRQPRPGWIKVAFAAAVLVAIVAAVVLGRGRGGGVVATPSAGAQATVAQPSAGSPLELGGSDPLTGKRVSLASYTGKPIVLNMWASWCTGCYAEARALATFTRTHPQAQVIGVDIQDTKAAAAGFYRRFGWRHPSIFDPAGRIAAQLGLQGLPTTLFLDRRHRIVARIVGETNLAGFSQGLREALRK